MEVEKNRLILILILIIIVLLGIIAYAFILKPTINGYIVNAQNEGVQYAVYTIMQHAKQCQQVPLVFKNETINVVWIDCLQQNQEQSSMK